MKDNLNNMKENDKRKLKTVTENESWKPKHREKGK